MSQSNGVNNGSGNGSGQSHGGKLLLGAIVLAIIFFVFTNIDAFGAVLLVAVGFGFVIMIHEFGHFIIAKLAGIKVEAFSIGFPPTLIGIRKTKDGFKMRFLMGNREHIESDDQDDSTEYRIGLVPFGGFVKMMGQEDVGAAQKSGDKRSFANKPVWIRIAVVGSGVLFNAISACLIFMAVFLIGIKLPPAVVGGVRPGSPADVAGLRAGDRITAVEGDTFVDFSSLPLAGALSKRGEAVEFTVEHPDGKIEKYELIAKQPPNVNIRMFGIEQANSLKIADLDAPELNEEMFGRSGLKPGDVITAVNGEPVKNFYEYRQAIENAYQSSVTLTVKSKKVGDYGGDTRQVSIPIYLNATLDDFDKGYRVAHIFSMLPRLKVLSVDQGRRYDMKPGDIIVQAGGVEYPSYEEFRKVTEDYDSKEMPITLMRKNPQGRWDKIETVVEPSSPPGGGRVTVGVLLVLDGENPIVADTIAGEDGPGALEIPPGSIITSVAGQRVETFFEVIKLIRTGMGQTVEIEFVKPDKETGSVSADVPATHDYINVTCETAPFAPEDFTPTAGFILEQLEEEYKASNPVKALSMGLKKGTQFAANTYLTLRRLFTRDVSPKTLVGPVGIVTMSYQIAKHSVMDYVYFMGMLSCVIAVMNLLPIPVVDGGVIVMLIIEKIKGSPINEKVQQTISYVGLALLIALGVWLLFNDIIRFFLS